MLNLSFILLPLHFPTNKSTTPTLPLLGSRRRESPNNYHPRIMPQTHLIIQLPSMALEYHHLRRNPTQFLQLFLQPLDLGILPYITHRKRFFFAVDVDFTWRPLDDEQHCGDYVDGWRCRRGYGYGDGDVI